MKCQTCTTRQAAVTNFRGDLGDVKKKLIRAQNDPAERNVATYLADIDTLKTKLEAAEARLAEHLADCPIAEHNATGGNRFGPKISDEDRHELLAMYREGIPTAEIAEAFGVTRTAVHYHAKRAGLDRRRARRVTPDERATILDRRRRGETLDSIAEALDLGHTTVQNVCTEAGLAGGLRVFFHDEDLDWQNDGLCSQTDPEAFFPEKGGSTREAKAICNGRPADAKHAARPPCPVRAECLKYAFDHGIRFGIWGGVSERDRRKLEKQQRAAS